MITATTAFAHSGRTDSSGGHHDNKNKSGLGSYHYHCGGHPAHLHENGVCPYDTPVFDEPEPTYYTPTPTFTAPQTTAPAQEQVTPENDPLLKALQYQAEYIDFYNLLNQYGVPAGYETLYSIYQQRAQLIYQITALSNEQYLAQVSSNLAIQTVLATKGYYTGDMNGLYDAITINAMIAFQAANGLPQTGLPDAQTLALLGV